MLSALFSNAQSLNNNWKKDLNNSLIKLNECENTNLAGVNSCNEFMASALTSVYKIQDFYSKEEGRHMLANEISYFLKNSSNWKVLGKGFEQDALKEAQSLANASKAVVSVYLNNQGIGHVSIILPGDLKLSGTWGFMVPNSASFFPGDPQKSYVDKGLSYSFEKTMLKDVVLYARNY
jgi:hypothetical protein